MTINELILDNMTGKDIIAISYMSGYSTSKINKYLRGCGSLESEYSKILDVCYEYFVNKYKELLIKLDCAKNSAN
jgi:hypothetical protein